MVGFTNCLLIVTHLGHVMMDVGACGAFDAPGRCHDEVVLVVEQVQKRRAHAVLSQERGNDRAHGLVGGNIERIEVNEIDQKAESRAVGNLCDDVMQSLSPGGNVRDAYRAGKIGPDNVGSTVPG